MVDKIEIKGLAAGVQAARKGIADARAAVAGMHEAGASLNATVTDVTAALKAAEADIRFEAQQLGNGGPTSAASETQSITTADIADIKQVAPLAQTFRADPGGAAAG